MLVTCTVCGKLMKRKPSRAQGNIYCSIKCRDVMRSRRAAEWRASHPNTECPVCGKKFYSDSGRKAQTCSKTCDSLHRSHTHRGERSHFWKGGKTARSQLIRCSLEYRRWREAVLKRDGYTCQHCGVRPMDTGVLHAHHIKPFARYVALRFEVSNGVTLCHDCHEVEHGRHLAKTRLQRQREHQLAFNLD